MTVMLPQTHHRYATIDGHQLFYREAGPKDGPVVLLLHGFPASSYMFRDLIPRLADRYRVIAPDMLAFGFSDTPTTGEFDYTFKTLADVTTKLLDHLGVDSFAVYVQDYGAPVGWRLALARPEAVWAVVSQNGNAYVEGFVPEFWQPIWDYTHSPGPETEKAVRAGLGMDLIRWQYTHGVPDPSVVSPDTWEHDFVMVNRPGNDVIQLRLVADYENNVKLYPQVQQYFRTSQVPLLAIWGRNDGIFAPEGAEAFRRDLPKARVELVDGGHFLLETALNEVAQAMDDFLAQASEGR
jgi:pimeloyl-ACP methyl ester carboxylesterase